MKVPVLPQDMKPLFIPLTKKWFEKFERVGWLRYAVGNFKYWIGGKR